MLKDNPEADRTEKLTHRDNMRPLQEHRGETRCSPDNHDPDRSSELHCLGAGGKQPESHSSMHGSACCDDGRSLRHCQLVINGSAVTSRVDITMARTLVLNVRD